MKNIEMKKSLSLQICVCDKKIKARGPIVIRKSVSENVPTSIFDHTSFSNPTFHYGGPSRERL